MRTFGHESEGAVDQDLQELAVFLHQIDDDREADGVPDVSPLSLADLAPILIQVFGIQPPVPEQPPLVTLSARMPFHDVFGGLDAHQPARWDAVSGLVWMEGIVHAVGEVGMLAGTVVDVDLPGVPTGNYLVVGTFTGRETTMQMSGPWGLVTAFTAQKSDTGSVIAMTHVPEGQGLSFTLTSKNPGVAFLKAVQLFSM